MLKVVWNVIKKIFGIFGIILSPLKRLVCRRKRRNSDTILPLTNHYPSVENLSSNGISQTREELGSWDTWEDESNQIRSVQQYRQHQQQKLQQQISQEEEPQTDYFSGMAPRLQKQKKLFIKQKDESINTQSISSKLAPMDVPLSLQTSELGQWDDDNNAWEAEAETDLTWEADNVIREKRRQERQQRHLEQQRKKQERELKQNKYGQHGHLNAVKLS